jgi:hypothetical protein
MGLSNRFGYKRALGILEVGTASSRLFGTKDSVVYIRGSRPHYLETASGALVLGVASSSLGLIHLSRLRRV